MSQQNRKYDVALSFCHEDESLATDLAERLIGLRVFIYPKKQEQLAGADGMEAFAVAFREDSNLVVVLHRDSWGKTPWTRIEEAAIKDKCLRDGWDSLFVVRTNQSGSLPKWVPSSHLYFQLKHYPIEQLVGAIKVRAQAAGSLLEPESPVEKANRIHRQHEYEKETQLLMRQPDGTREAEKLVNQMLDAVAAMSVEVSKTGIKIDRGGSAGHYVWSAGVISLVMNWQKHANAIEPIRLRFDFFKGRVPTPEQQSRGAIILEEPVRMGSFSLNITRTPAHGFCFKNGRGEVLTAEIAANRIMDAFLTEYERRTDSGRR